MGYQQYMELALSEAKKGVKHGEQPYGAVLISDGKVVAKVHSKVHSSNNKLKHAEVVLFEKYEKKASKKVDKLTLVTTCEPCIKCFGLAIKYGVKNFVYGSQIETAIKYGSGDILLKIKEFKNNYNILVTGGILEEKCDIVLKDFYYKNILAVEIVSSSKGTDKEKFWMKKALEIGKEGMIKKHELPIGVILVAGDEILSQSSTLTYTMNSPITHGDFMALYKAQREIYSNKCKRPLVLYSTLEPHLLGFGAAMKCKVDKIVYGLEAIPDGGSCYLSHMVGVKEYIPKVVGGIYRQEQYLLLKEFIGTHKENRVGYDYAQKLISLYEKGAKK